EWRIVAREHRLFEELLRIVVPELADVGIALDRHVRELAVPFLDPTDIDREDQIAIFVELDRSARRFAQRYGTDRLDQRIAIVNLAAGRLECGFENLAVDVERRRIESDRDIGAV